MGCVGFLCWSNLVCDLQTFSVPLRQEYLCSSIPFILSFVLFVVA
ncbi:hypothetical protein T11_5881 [Trichinella zimbabwensis]|uniref:Uncharacterized protein n=1 Tax=Trichinella zimbabwensis TaxID=268475 RepID=A0A0V1DS32_9BILA|nr:hypothetical protein T11_5881 [Trichinella zimbabwensis]